MKIKTFGLPFLVSSFKKSSFFKKFFFCFYLFSNFFFAKSKVGIFSNNFFLLENLCSFFFVLFRIFIVFIKTKEDNCKKFFFFSLSLSSSYRRLYKPLKVFRVFADCKSKGKFLQMFTEETAGKKADNEKKKGEKQLIFDFFFGINYAYLELKIFCTIRA